MIFNKKKNNNGWRINKNNTDIAKYPINAPLKQAVKHGNKIARKDRNYVYISKEIYQFSLRHEPALKKYAIIVMSDRIVEWTPNSSNSNEPRSFLDAKEAVEYMFGVQKRLSIPQRFGEFMRTNSINCIYCDNGKYEAADHIVAWDRWGKRGHHEANWVPACSKCNGNKSNKILGIKGWQKILNFYETTTGQDYVCWAKKHLEKKIEDITWESHFGKVKIIQILLRRLVNSCLCILRHQIH